MSDEPYRFAINPIVAEGNARRLVNVVAEFFRDGVRSEDLRIRYEQITNLRRQSYFDSLAYCKHRGWIVGGGKGVPYRLNADVEACSDTR